MKRGKFSLSYYNLTSCNQGQLVPIGLTEVLPGDSIQHATSLLLRTQPLVTPVMHPVHVRIHHWFVPHRLVWNDWETFITGGEDPDNPPTFPTVTFSTPAAIGDLADYLGVPTGVTNMEVSALPFRGYALIFNEWYRDQDLTTALTIDKTDGADGTTNRDLQFCAWEKDYFTSARPWAQKGDPVTLPLGTTAPVKGIGKLNQNWSSGPLNVYETDESGTTSYADFRQIGEASDDAKFIVEEDPNNAGFPGIYTDLANATSADVNDIRMAMALQRYQEARARYGSRYTEYLRYLGVRSSDARLQRPEYLGGGKQTIQFSEVLQTAPTTSGTPTTGVGSMQGHGISAARTNRYRRFFEEHGYVFTLLSVKPKTCYFEGAARHYMRRTREDFWQRELQHVGQQEIMKGELYAVGTSADRETWGYQDRYDEYRRGESRVTGNFKTTLNTWHMARDFSSLPSLDDDFVTANPTTRVYQATTSPQLYIMAYHSMQARRLVAQTGTSFIY